MSKSKKNVVDPEDIIKEYGADTARLFMLSDSPPERDINWTLSGINGAWKFTQKFWRTVNGCSSIFSINLEKRPLEFTQESNHFRKKIHKYLMAITESIENFQMNVAVAKIHELTNEISMFKTKSDSDKWCQKEALTILIKVVEPIMPHLAEECWHQIGNKSSIINYEWPKIEVDLMNDSECLIIVQINGKKRAEIRMQINSTEKVVFKEAMCLINIKGFIKSEELIKKKIFIKNKILNIVI